jgi:ADP-L-glycero-D-manno-heptose 6-epimerase
MIVVTGAAGFIGSCLINRLNQDNFNAIVAVDDFSKTEKEGNLASKKIKERVHREQFFEWLEQNHQEVEFIFHLGARTDTTEFDVNIFKHLNLEYSQKVWQACLAYQIPLVYASSAATYGLGEFGYDDDESKIHKLKPLNPYGQSKQDFDLWALKQEQKPFFLGRIEVF